MSERISDVDDVEGSRMSFSRGDDPYSTQVTASSDEAEVSSFKLDEVNDLSLCEVVSNGVIDFDERIWVSNGSSIMGDDERNPLWSKRHPPDSEKLVCCLILRDLVENESSFDVIEDSEVVVGLVNGHDICLFNKEYLSSLLVIRTSIEAVKAVTVRFRIL